MGLEFGLGLEVRAGVRRRGSGGDERCWRAAEEDGVRVRGGRAAPHDWAEFGPRFQNQANRALTTRLWADLTTILRHGPG